MSAIPLKATQLFPAAFKPSLALETMIHVVKILSLLVADSTYWIALLYVAILLLCELIHGRIPICFVVSLGCYEHHKRSALSQ
ncbi:hypothetical protein IGI04_025955 [Brassica rapa subsp. trilocularis]|uniref:Uncharacterized protein n=1 Tax=Brassica rapa subsp. trilocularis TaxID=1813537 RepID=A0ABQ7KUK0_BRACM|nr:hypothetical protein IGI04_025955 [Brassica rapa subsp. trilocularis]